MFSRNCRGGFFIGFEFYQPSLFFVCLIDMFHAIDGGLIVSGSLSSMWPASFGRSACLDFGPWPLVSFFFHFLVCFLIMEFGRV
jgi:hypothetical protein